MAKFLQIAADVRALQDENFATKGIGQHSFYVLSLLRRLPRARLTSVSDPLMGDMRQDAAPFFARTSQGPAGVQGDVYLNPSPLTHDTSLFIAARRRGMLTGAVVHDFIPLRQPEFLKDEAAFAAYDYLVQSLRKYDFLVANSDFTAREIETVLPGYTGQVVTLHCKSRFNGTTTEHNSTPVRRQHLGALRPGEAYVFVGAADDPRKNTDIAIRAAAPLRNLGVRLVIGGGLGEATRKRLLATFPDQFYLGEPIFLPRLTDDELRDIYAGAACVIVTSLDEGFSLPVAEGISAGRPVAASNIPAHREQILAQELLFEPFDVDGLVRAVGQALKLGRTPGFTESAYHRIDHKQEGERFHALFTRRTAPPPPRGQLKIIGPESGKPTGIAVYNRGMIEECTYQGRDFEYVDVDSLDAPAFYAWLFANQDNDILYVMGNNNIFHNFCYDAILNLPGACIMHDSRLFEFLLNRQGPYKIVDLFNHRHKTRPIGVETVHDWARERRKLPYSVLDPLVTRCTHILVHSRILEQHIRAYYRYENVHTLPFALQLSDEQISSVMAMQTARPRTPEQIPHIVMLGETEPTKGCSEIILALKLLHLMGIKAKLFFVGKSEDPYHEELLRNVTTLQLEEDVEFLSYVSRELYLEYLGHADVVVQLRYALFGQVSGPLGDAVACGVPVVTTEDLAQGMAVELGCTVIPNAFSPLHIAEAIRSILGGNDGERQRIVNRMGDYVTQLFALLAK